MTNLETGYTRDRLIKWLFFIVLEAERSKTKVLADGALVYLLTVILCAEGEKKPGWVLLLKITSPTLRAPAI